MNYVDDIQKFKPFCEQEKNDKSRIVSLISEYSEKLLYRENELFHFTSAGIVMNKSLDKMLMVHHNIYNSWSWAGGHADGEADLISVATREVKEETGVSSIKLLWEQPISVDILTTAGHIKKGKYISSHLHLNISYLFMADEKKLLCIKPDENSGVEWVPVDMIEDYITDKEMLIVYRKIIMKIKKWQSGKNR